MMATFTCACCGVAVSVMRFAPPVAHACCSPSCAQRLKWQRAKAEGRTVGTVRRGFATMTRAQARQSRSDQRACRVCKATVRVGQSYQRVTGGLVHRVCVEAR